jgi:archaellum component FlaC
MSAHENLCPNCMTYRKVARDFSQLNERLSEQCAKQAEELRELRKRLAAVRRALAELPP